MRKRIPTLLALTLLIASIAFGIFLFNVQRSKNESEKNTFQPQNISVANITSTSATIIWHTNTPTVGKVHINNTTHFDDRDDPQKPTVGHTHFVTVENLQPGTEYKAEIENNSIIYSEEPVLITTINAEIAEKATLNPELSPIRGTVLSSAQQPAQEAIIILNLKDASPKATYVTTAGNYILPTTKLINSSLTDTLQLPNQQPATLEVRSGNRISFAQITLPIKEHTLPSITLGKNENFTAFLSQPAPTPVALEFRQKPQNYDLNNDGRVNTLDSSLLSDFIARQEFNETVDFNTDNKIDDQDLELIKQNLD